MDEPVRDQKVSNVIEDNLTLRKELKEAFSEINRLEKEKIVQKQHLYKLDDKIEKLKEELKAKNEGTSSPAKNKQRIVEESIREHLDI